MQKTHNVLATKYPDKGATFSHAFRFEPHGAWLAGRWPLAAGRWPLAAGRWPLAAGRLARWPLAAWLAGRLAACSLLEASIVEA